MASKLTLAEILAGLGKGERYQAPKDKYGFYSPTEEGIVNVNMGKGQGPQWLGELSKQQGVTKSELQDAGLIDYLETTEGPITKEMVFDYFQANRPQLARDVGEIKGPAPMPVSVLPHDLPPMQVNRELMDDPRKLYTRTLLEGKRREDEFAYRGNPILKEYLKQYPEAATVVERADGAHQVPSMMELWAKRNKVETPAEFSRRFAGFEMMQNPPRVGTYPDPDPMSRYESLQIMQNPTQIEVVGKVRGSVTDRDTLATAPLPRTNFMRDGASSEAVEHQTLSTLRDAIMKRNNQQINNTRVSAWAKPLNPQTYKEELFYRPQRSEGEKVSKTTAHWGDTPNPTAHTLSDVIQLEDGTKAVNLLETQADTQIRAHKAGGWEPTAREMEESSKRRAAAGGRVYDAESNVNYATSYDMIDFRLDEVTPDRFRIRDPNNGHVGDYIPSTGEFQGAQAFRKNDALPQLKEWADAHIAKKAADEAHEKLDYAFRNFPNRVPLTRESKTKGIKGKAMEWEKFNLKRVLQRAVDEDADGIMIPNSEELVAKYARGTDGDDNYERAYKKFYDKNLPEQWQKYMKEFGTGAPEVREGPDGVKRLFLPINEKLRNEIKTRGLPMYGKRGLADVLGEQYV